MSKESVLTRMLLSMARVEGYRFRAGYMSQAERQKILSACHELIDAPIRIDDTPSLHLMDIRAKVRRMRAEGFDVQMVVVDYLQLMPSRGKTENRNQEVSALSRGMKLLSKELHVPFVVLSQLSRAVEQRQGDHRPQLSDLRESGSIEQDADVVGFVFREEMYNRDREDLKGLAEYIVAKQRNGAVGTVNLVWLGGFTKFENRAEDWENQETHGDD
jgi:replicative DNA helicase